MSAEPREDADSVVISFPGSQDEMELLLEEDKALVKEANIKICPKQVIRIWEIPNLVILYYNSRFCLRNNL